MTSILLFAGSVRRWAFSRRLAAAAGLAVARHGGKPTMVDLADYEAPLYNADIEDSDGIPQGVLDFRRLVATHDTAFRRGCWIFAGLLPRMMRCALPHPNIMAG